MPSATSLSCEGCCAEFGAWQCLQALCTEASLHALRRQYPQIYETSQRLVIDPSSIHVERRDFMSAFRAITPSSHRAAATHARSVTA